MALSLPYEKFAGCLWHLRWIRKPKPARWSDLWMFQRKLTRIQISGECCWKKYTLERSATETGLLIGSCDYDTIEQRSERQQRMISDYKGEDSWTAN